MPEPSSADAPASSRQRRPASVHDAERWREAVVMALYVALVLLTALVVLPSDYDSDHGDLGLLAIVWGTTIGLAITHWFAFVLAAAALNEGTPSVQERRLAGAQLIGAGSVAVLTSIPLLLAPKAHSLAVASFAPAVIIGVAGYGVVRARGYSVWAGLAGATVFALFGVAIAAVKLALAGH